MGERRLCTAEVRGSNPLGSTKKIRVLKVKSEVPVEPIAPIDPSVFAEPIPFEYLAYYEDPAYYEEQIFEEPYTLGASYDTAAFDAVSEEEGGGFGAYAAISAD